MPPPPFSDLSHPFGWPHLANTYLSHFRCKTWLFFRANFSLALWPLPLTFVLAPCRGRETTPPTQYFVCPDLCPWLLRLGQRLCPIVLCFLLCSQFSLFRWLIKLQVRVFSSRHFLTLSASVTCISVSLYRCIWASIPVGFIDCTRFGKCPALCKPSGYISCARCCALSYTLKTYEFHGRST